MKAKATTTETFAEALRRVRAREGLSRPDLAKKLGVYHGSIMRWENEGLRPADLALEKLRTLYPGDFDRVNIPGRGTSKQSGGVRAILADLSCRIVSLELTLKRELAALRKGAGK